MKRAAGAVVLLVAGLAVYSAWRSPGEMSPAEVRDVATAQTGPAAESSSQTGVGTVAGTVRYATDPARRWPQARYYVRNVAGKACGPLAEVVVALRGAPTGGVSQSPEPATATIDQKNFQFVPETVAIRAGDAVRFLNSDPEIHNVRTNDGEHPFNVSLASASEHVCRFRRAGGMDRPIRLGCAFHGSMRGWIYVFDQPFFCVTARGGRFRFDDVPAGEYWLELVHPAGDLRWKRRVEIGEGDSLDIDIAVSPDNRHTSKS